MPCLLKLFTFWLCLSQTYALVEDISTAFDLLLVDLRALIKAENYTEIPVSGINMTRLECDPGILSDLSTIERKGNATINLIGDDVAFLNATIGLGDFYLIYPSCLLAGIFRRTLEITATENTVSFQVAVHHIGTKCYANLDSINIDLNGIQISTGTSFYNIIEDSLLKWIAKYHKDQLLKSIYKWIWSQAKLYSNKNICRG